MEGNGGIRGRRGNDGASIPRFGSIRDLLSQALQREIQRQVLDLLVSEDQARVQRLDRRLQFVDMGRRSIEISLHG